MTLPGKNRYQTEILKGSQILLAVKKNLYLPSFFDAWREKKYVKDEREGMKIY
jgi:hypothetical protein